MVKIKIILTLVFLALAYINYRHLNIGFLSLYSIDEYAFHGSLVYMYDGLTSLDIKKLFYFRFYSYGFGFFFINLIATAPFFAVDNIEMTIYIPRIITSLFAVGSVWFVYKTARLYSTKYISILIALIILTMPGFYRNALWFHPDWMMTFFVVLSVYLFAKDDWNFKKYFWWATAAFGFSLATKIQAITFIPFVFLYIFYDSFKYKTFKGLKQKIKLFFKSIGIALSIFIIANPYLIHPSGLKAFTLSFVANMKSNAENHGVDAEVTISDKLLNVIDFYYMEVALFIIILALAIYISFTIFKKSSKKSILPLISIYFIVNIAYLFFIVNKDWQHYYLTIFTLIPLILMYVTNRFNKYNYLILGIFIAVQVSLHIPEYRPLLNPIIELSKEERLKISNDLNSVLEPFVTSDTNILISAYQPFDFRSIGLVYENVHLVSEEILEDMFVLEVYLKKPMAEDRPKFKQKDFIVLSKNSIYFKEGAKDKRVDKKGYEESLKIIKNFNNGGSLGYEKFKETRYFYIWKKKK